MQHRHFIIYKPFGYISQFKTDSKKKKLLGDLYSFPDGTMAIGRLDEDSEGLLLLTTNGKLSELVRSRNIEKEYYTQLDGVITDKALQQLQQRVEITLKDGKYSTQPCAANIIATPELPLRGRKIRDDRHGPTSWVSITLTEGKNRQVRKMTAAVSYPTLRLVRVRIGRIMLGPMAPAEVIEIPDLEAIL